MFLVFGVGQVLQIFSRNPVLVFYAGRPYCRRRAIAENPVAGERAAISQWILEPPSCEAVTSGEIGLRQSATFEKYFRGPVARLHSRSRWRSILQKRRNRRMSYEA